MNDKTSISHTHITSIYIYIYILHTHIDKRKKMHKRNLLLINLQAPNEITKHQSSKHLQVQAKSQRPSIRSSKLKAYTIPQILNFPHVCKKHNILLELFSSILIAYVPLHSNKQTSQKLTVSVKKSMKYTKHRSITLPQRYKDKNTMPSINSVNFCIRTPYTITNKLLRNQQSQC